MAPHQPAVRAASRSSLRIGRAEKNLCRQGSHRNAGIPSIRQSIEITPGTCSGAMRFTSVFPQISQCAYSMWLSGLGRARNRFSHVLHRHGRTPKILAAISRKLRLLDRLQSVPWHTGQITGSGLIPPSGMAQAYSRPLYRGNPCFGPCPASPIRISYY